MQCFIEDKNYKQFEDIYGDEGVNYVYSQFLQIPLIKDIVLLDEETQSILEQYRINKTKSDIENNLKSIFGNDLKDSDIQFVTNLGSSIAQFKANGQILFDELTLQNNGVEYHEAFHRVFRMYMEDTERQKLYDEVRKANPSKPWLRYKEQGYLTEEEQIEELLADDFMKYTIEKDYKNKSYIAKFFFKLYKFISELFSRPDRLNSIYDKILNGGYEGQFSKTPLLADANKYKLAYNTKQGTVYVDLSIEDKNATVDELLRSFVNELFKGDPYDLFQNKSFDVNKLLDSMMKNFITKDNLSPEFKELIRNNFMTSEDGIRKEFSKRLKLLGIDLDVKTKVIKAKEESTIEKDDNENNPENTDLIGKDNDIEAFDVPSFQTDPNNTVSQLVKLRVSVIKDTRNKTKSYITINNKKTENTYSRFIKFGEAYKSINKILAKSPADIDVMLYLLENKVVGHIAEDLIPSLEDYKNKNPKFVTDFVSTLAKTSYNFGRALITKDGFKVKELAFGLPQAKMIRDIANSISDSNVSKDRSISSIKQYLPEFIGNSEQKKLVNRAVENINNEGLHGLKVKDVIIALHSLSTGQQIESFSDFKGINNVNEHKANIINLRNLLEKYAKLIVAYEGLEETMHLTLDGKPMYDISLDTTQSKTIKILDFIQIVSPNKMIGRLNYSELFNLTNMFKTDLASKGFEEALDTLNENPLARLVLLNYYLPQIVNTYTFVEEGELKIQSEILRGMLLGNLSTNLVVIDGIIEQTSGSDESKDLGTMSMAEMNMYYINNLYNDVYDTIKHSDRSTFFGYIFKDSEGKKKNPFQILKTDSKEKILEKTTEMLTERLMVAEKSYYNSTKDSTIQYQNNYFMRKEGKKDIPVYDNGDITHMRNAFDEMIREPNLLKELKRHFDNQIESIEEVKSLKESVEKAIYSWLDKSIVGEDKSWKANLVKDNIIRREGNLFKVNDIFSKYIPTTTYSLDNILTYSFCNAVMFHMEEQTLIYGHFGQYKNADDLYKRMNTHSGTGRTFDVSRSTNERIAEEMNNTEFSLYDVNSKELISDIIYNKYANNSKPTITLATLSEYDNYYTHDQEKLKSDITNSIANLGEIFEAEGLSKEEIEKRIKKQIDNFTGAYDRMNTPDGQSYCSIFFFKEYKDRLGEWTEDHEVLFQAELEILSIDAYSEDIEKQKNEVLKKHYKRIMNRKNSLNELAKIDKRYSLQEIIELHLHSFEVLKPQYGGLISSVRDMTELHDFNDRVYTYGIDKTSLFPMLPSIILGTNLSKLNSIMLKQGKDIISMQSATKTGCIDYKKLGKKMIDEILAVDSESKTQILKDKYQVKDLEDLYNISTNLQKEGLEVYNNAGKFNTHIENVFSGATQYIQWEYFKDQVKIHDHPKEAIRNSTQSMKNVLANCYIVTKNGKLPSDLIKEYNKAEDKAKYIQDWNNLSNEEKRSKSNLYKYIEDYQDSLRDLVESELKSLLEEIKYSKDLDKIENFDRFHKLLVDSAEDRNSAENMIEALNLFGDPQYDKILETLSNKGKVEPIIYSLVTKIINFKRPGNGVPMVSSQLFESLNDESKTDRDKSSTVLKSYEIKDNKLVPAEIVLPLPRSLFSKVIKAVNRAKGTNIDNIFDALPIYNEMLKNKEREFILKGLRIPNQQYSSTDVLQVKEFKLPTLESFIFIYPEIVAKTGGD